MVALAKKTQHYQQAVDITINEGEEAYFRVIGTHSVHLTGNYIVPEEDILGSDSDDESESDDEIIDPAMYGLEHLDEISEEDSEDSEDDELDDLDDPRIMEVESDEDEVPKLVKVEKSKAKGNKRPATESDEEKPVTNGTDQKLSKRQAKKLKNNAGQAVASEKEVAKPAKESSKKDSKKGDTPASTGKKVQFAEKLEQGPTGSNAKGAEKKAPRVVSGVTIDDKKSGSGPGAKKGDSVAMRYIGKLQDGKVFDCQYHVSQLSLAAHAYF
jgi:FK506-binding nuclear protein